MNDLLLYQNISALPEDLKKELMAFLEYLKQKDEKKKRRKKPEFGSGKGIFEMAEDFDEPLIDFKKYMP